MQTEQEKHNDLLPTKQYIATRKDSEGKDVSFPLIVRRIQKGNYKDVPYLSLPDVTADNFIDVARFMSEEKIQKHLTLWFNQMGVQAMYAAAKYDVTQPNEPITEIDWDDVLNSWEELRVQQDTLESMKERKDTLLAEIGEVLMAAINSGDAGQINTAKGIAETNRQEVQKLDRAIKERQEEFVQRAANRKDRSPKVAVAASAAA